MSTSQPTPSGEPPSLASLLLRLIALLAVLMAMLLVSAGRVAWLQAWLFGLAYAAFLFFYGFWGLRNDPDQLAERSQKKENVKRWDTTILSFYTILLAVMLVLAGLDGGRFHWASVPFHLQTAGWIALLLAGGWIWWTTSVNTFLSRYVRIQDDRGQQTVTRGPYRWVRHPMYLGIIVFMPTIPLVLGSGWALVPAVLIDALFVLRTALEDRALQTELDGYKDYAQKVRYRLIPGIW